MADADQDALLDRLVSAPVGAFGAGDETTTGGAGDAAGPAPGAHAEPEGDPFASDGLGVELEPDRDWKDGAPDG